MRRSTLATALALIAVPSIAAAELNLVVSGDVDPDLVRVRIVEELGTPTNLVADPAACAAPCLDVAISGAQATVVFSPANGPIRARAVALGDDPAQWPVLVTLLAGNLVRDEASTLLAELPPPPPAAVVAPPTFAPSAEIHQPEYDQPFVLGILPFVSTDLSRAARTRHKFALHAVAGIGGGVDGLAISGAADLQLGTVRGGQIGGAVAAATRVRGFQLGGAVAAASELDGFQLGGAVAYAHHGGGVQVGGAVAAARGPVYLQIGGALAASAGTAHSQIGGALAIARGATGFQVGGAAAVARGSANVQVGGALAIAGKHADVQVGGAVTIAAGTAHVQVAGAINVANDVSGLQLAPINIARRVRGVQLGVINIGSDEGVSLGLINIVPGGRTDVEAVVASSSIGAVLLRHGSRRWHNVYAVAGHPVDESGVSDGVWMYGLGFGPTWHHGSTTVDLELMGWQVNHGAAHETDLSILGQLRLSVAHDLGPASIVVGGAVNSYISSDPMAPLLVERRPATTGMTQDPDGFDVDVAVWPSAFVGVRL